MCNKSWSTDLHRCRCWVAHPTRTTWLMTDSARLPQCRQTWRVWSVRRGWTCPGGTTPAPPRGRTVLPVSTGCSGTAVETRPGSSLLLSEENEKGNHTHVIECLPSVNGQNYEKKLIANVLTIYVWTSHLYCCIVNFFDQLHKQVP